MTTTRTGPTRPLPPAQGGSSPPVQRPPALPVEEPRRLVVSPGPAAPPPPPPNLLDRILQGSARCVRAFRVLAYTAVPLVLLAALAAGIVMVRLRHGPIALDIVVKPIERGINAELAAYSVRIGGAELRLGARNEFEFRLRDIKVVDDGSDVVASAPLAAVNISEAALWRGRVVPERVELIEPVITLVYSKEDGLALDTEPLPPEPPEQTGTAPAARPNETSVPVQSSNQPRQLNLMKLLSDSSLRARHRLDATSYLTEFGLTDATVALHYNGQQSRWQVPEASVDFNHARSRSVISGRARVQSPKGPWALTFVTDEVETSGRISIKTTVRDLVPSALASAAPPLEVLSMIDAPLAGDATVEVSTSGEIEKSFALVEIGGGTIRPLNKVEPFPFFGGLLRIGYDGAAKTWMLEPSPVKWAGGSMTLSASAHQGEAQPGSERSWGLAFEGRGGMFEASEFNAAAVAVDLFKGDATLWPESNSAVLNTFTLAGGGGQTSVKAKGRLGQNGIEATADVAISPMPLQTLKAFWPRFFGQGARRWTGERVSAANFKGGKIRYESGSFIQHPETAQPSDAEKTVPERVSAAFEAGDVAFEPLPGMYPVVAPRMSIQIVNNNLDVSIPDGAVAVPGNKQVPLKSGRMTSNDVLLKRTDSEISFSAQSQLGPFLETVEQVPVRAIKDAPPLPKAAEGKIDAQFKIKLPLVSGISSDDVEVEGKAKISDGKFGKAGGQFDVQGFTLALDLLPGAIDAKGDLLVNGVPAKIAGRRVFGAGAGEQPPVKVTANLDDADRAQLGLDINDIVHGTVPIEITMQKGQRPEPVIKVKADLTNAEIAFDAISWRKPVGSSATLETDIVPGTTNKTELQNLRIAGDDIAIEGWAGIGADNKLREFYFPSFALSLISKLEVQGTLRPDNVWDVKARGPRFDGRELFRSLFNVGDGQSSKAKSGKSSAGTDLNAEVDTILGATEGNMHGLKLKLSTRSGKLVALDVKGTLDGNVPVAAVLDQSQGNRRLLAESSDAGEVMRFINFYPNVKGGRLRLEVNLDGKGAADKTGVLWIDNFKILGDPIVNEVVNSSDQGRPAIGGKRAVTRETFDFDRLRAPFSAGYGQFVLEESYIKGPLVGANLRGKVDFKSKQVNIGGTYIPLQGLNGAFGEIPVLGQIISGAHGEGIFGITFAVQGALSDPQVIVNPLSMVAPGFLRDIFQITGANPKVQAREDRVPDKPVEQRVRSSSAAADAPPVAPVTPPAKKTSKKKATPPAVDGWASTTQH